MFDVINHNGDKKLSTEYFYIIPVIACFIVLLILMIGIGVFAKGGSLSQKYSNKLMRYRVIAQAIAVLIILGYVFLQQGAT